MQLEAKKLLEDIRQAVKTANDVVPRLVTGQDRIEDKFRPGAAVSAALRRIETLRLPV